MKHFGTEPPWRGEGNYGYWRWVPPSADDWLDEPGHWRWHPPRSLMARLSDLLVSQYKPAISAALNDALMQDFGGAVVRIPLHA